MSILEAEAKLSRRERRSTRRLFEELRGRGSNVARDDVLASMAFPREHRRQILSTNPVERLNGEISAGPTSSASSRTSGPLFAWSER